jgi:hypothetical protein
VAIGLPTVPEPWLVAAVVLVVELLVDVVELVDDVDVGVVVEVVLDVVEVDVVVVS